MRELGDVRANSEADIAGLKSEETALSSELESAAELAERQGALALTLEGRLEALSAERAMLSAQFHASQNELEQYRSELFAAMNRAVETAKDVVTSSSEFHKISEATSLSPVNKVVDSVCLALSVLAGKVPQLSDELIEAQARLEMNQITKIARSGGVKGGLEGGTGSAAAVLEQTPLRLNENVMESLSRHKDR